MLFYTFSTVPSCYRLPLLPLQPPTAADGFFHCGCCLSFAWFAVFAAEYFDLFALLRLIGFGRACSTLDGEVVLETRGKKRLSNLRADGQADGQGAGPD